MRARTTAGRCESQWAQSSKVPWTRIDAWQADSDLIKELSYVVAGMTLGEDAITLDELVTENRSHLTQAFGTKGHGLMPQADRQFDGRVTIPKLLGVDSLYVLGCRGILGDVIGAGSMGVGSRPSVY